MINESQRALPSKMSMHDNITKQSPTFEKNVVVIRHGDLTNNTFRGIRLRDKVPGLLYVPGSNRGIKIWSGCDLLKIHSRSVVTMRDPSQTLTTNAIVLCLATISTGLIIETHNHSDLVGDMVQPASVLILTSSGTLGYVWASEILQYDELCKIHACL
jgi:hypothetical protein